MLSDFVSKYERVIWEDEDSFCVENANPRIGIKTKLGIDLLTTNVYRLSVDYKTKNVRVYMNRVDYVFSMDTNRDLSKQTQFKIIF